MDSALGALSSISIAEDGKYAAQLNGKDTIIHLNPTSPDFKEVQIVKAKENVTKFLKFSRPRSFGPGNTRREQGNGSLARRMLVASDNRILVWQLNPLQLHAEIESAEPGATNIDFGGDENEIIVFHAWNTKTTIFSLDTGRSQVIKTPKFFHYNSFGYRPKTRQFAILLKPDTTDILTIHEFRSYELVNRAILPTVDAQGLKWSPDGKWIAVWDAASTGTKVLIFTADGQLFRTYSGPPESDSVFDLGVRNIEWSPVDDRTGLSNYLAVGKVDGNIDILKNKTFSCSTSLSHVFHIDPNSPSIWRERYADSDGDLEYAEASGSSAFSTVTDPSGPPRGVSIMAFSSDGSLLGTVDQTRPNIVWVWALGSTPGLVTALVHEHAVRQVIWHPSKTQLLITTANSSMAAVRYWSLDSQPMVIRVPIPRNESGRYDVRWLSSGEDDDSRFWFGTPEDYILGDIRDQDGTLQFQSFYSVHGKVQTGSYSGNASR
ncbi:hypothetical protein ASPWEDRAFT_68245 [Aspergillus wentii DTO 134E9]|uniref:Uncharacterized protein n=1 Tax=Aspergillus wentii DTO 134E9 TaxID=1073089 RepID=A0A1L9RIW7_ASPWE|nr:uncharacterized protein ASPWEDRAFT_68245 [Aspergillus wentii DTO 134E9]KAI9932243.1 hypothetical protein MW887_009753 [Aspergillus wentii]OJJ34798.1 hypothetical protein ASPWEDRAFT_68245 [Aspergillus wentii DTO 134E9]